MTYQSLRPKFNDNGVFDPFGWDAGNDPGAIYKLTERDLGRIGDCWMKGRLRVGDFVLCLKHTGDCFFDYCLIEIYHNGIKAILESRFGGYFLRGTPIKWRPDETEFKRLLDGEILTSKDRHPIWRCL